MLYHEVINARPASHGRHGVLGIWVAFLNWTALYGRGCIFQPYSSTIVKLVGGMLGCIVG